MAESVDRASAKLSSAKRRRFQTFEKICREKKPLVTIDKKGDTCVNSEVPSAVVKLLDLQTVSVISKSSILSCMELVRLIAL